VKTKERVSPIGFGYPLELIFFLYEGEGMISVAGMHRSDLDASEIGKEKLIRTLIAYEFEEPLAALMSSSARHSAMDLTLRNAESRVCGCEAGQCVSARRGSN
jgi:hypothetical protein